MDERKVRSPNHNFITIPCVVPQLTIHSTNNAPTQTTWLASYEKGKRRRPQYLPPPPQKYLQPNSEYDVGGGNIDLRLLTAKLHGKKKKKTMDDDFDIRDIGGVFMESCCQYSAG